MNNKEVLGNTEAQNENASEWTNQDFPEFNSAEKQEQEQVDIDKLAQDLVKARKDMREGATWDKEQRAYIGEDGLPRDWAHLVGYLKKNPDAIKTATETLNQLRGEGATAEESSAEEQSITETVAEESSVEPAEITNLSEAVAESESNTELSERAQSVLEYYKDNAEKGGGSPRMVMDNYKERLHEILDEASDRIKDAFALDESKRNLEMAQDQLNADYAELEGMSGLSLPWTEKGRKKRELRQRIKAGEDTIQSLSENVTTLEQTFAQAPLSDAEKATVEEIESIPKYIIQGGEVQRKRWQKRLEQLDEVEKQLELPEDKRDNDVIELVEPHVALFGVSRVEERIKKERQGIAALIKEIDEEYQPLRDKYKDAA